MLPALVHGGRCSETPRSDAPVRPSGGGLQRARPAPAGILDIAGALRLGDALFVAGLLLACGAGLLALEGSDAPLAPRLRAAPTFSMAGIADRAGLGIPLTRPRRSQS